MLVLLLLLSNLGTSEPKSLAKSAGNVFRAEFTPKSAGKAKSSSNGWVSYKVPRLAGGGSAPAHFFHHPLPYMWICCLSCSPRHLVVFFFLLPKIIVKMLNIKSLVINL